MKPPLVRELKYVKNSLMVGDDVRAMRRAGLKFMREPPSTLTERQQATFGEGMKALMWRCQDEAVQTPKNGHGDNKLLAAFRRAQAVDDYGDYLLTKFAAEHPLRKVPDLGPIYRGGMSVLTQDLTHNTDGLPPGSLYPAFDDGWKAGRVVTAVEAWEVIDQSGAAGGDAFFARGKSSIEYWVGHIVQAPATGTKFRKGQQVAVIANIPLSQGGPHVHLGINAKPLIGKDLVYCRREYQHCAPTVLEQLRKWAQA